MGNNRPPFAGSGRLQEGGALATRKQDFNAHWGGNGFRHDASNIDMNPVILGVGGDDVQAAIENLHDIVVTAGSGFISIGDLDGYAQGSYNVGAPDTPSFYDAFNAALLDTRLQNGGCILILAGTYRLSNTITLPPGITIMGEIGGTLIIGGMPETPMFSIDYDHKTVTVGGDTGSGQITLASGSDIEETKFYNLMLADNLDGYALFGEPTMTTVPMIRYKNGSNVCCERVSFIGRIHSGVLSARSKTLSALGNASGSGGGTTLTVKDCFFDAVGIGISFLPGGNNIDFLTVAGCKARTYGTEDSGSQGAALNCFINMSLCNATITDNYYVGGGTYTNTFLNVPSGSGTSVKIVMSGNSGGPTTLGSESLLANNSGTSFRTSISGNNWGVFEDNPWYIIVGGGSGSTALGDIIGTGAIDIVLGIANTVSNFKATVIVNPGTYTVTGNALETSNYANLRFIGNKHGNAYPIFNLNLTAATTDKLANRALTLGNYLESIEFNSVTNRHSIRPAFNPVSNSNIQTGGGTIEVKDCFFVNTSLFFKEPSGTPAISSSGTAISRKILVNGCHFLQDGTFTDTLSLAAPRVEIVHIDNCYFTGNGYAIAISAAGYNFSNTSSSVTISNTQCSMLNEDTAENYTITSQIHQIGPIDPFSNNYINITGVEEISINNFQVFVGADLSPGSPNDTVSTALTSTGEFVEFISLSAAVVNIENSVFTGPPQTVRYDGIAPDVAMPTLSVVATFSGRISNSKFWVGALPIQIADGTLTDTTFTDHFVIENCGIQSSSQTAIDFDMWLESQDVQPQITVRNCNIQSGGTAWPIHHTSFTANSHAAVQILAGDADVHFVNNTVTSSLSAVTAGTFTKYSGLYIDCSVSVGTTADQANSINVSGNTIYVLNSFAVANAAVSVSCAHLFGPVLKVHNNTLSMANSNTTGSTFTGCLVLDNTPVFATSYSDALVSGNIFCRSDLFGTLTTLLRGYVQILSTSINTGMIVDNFFDSSTYNGSSTTLVENNSVSPWAVVRNVNQKVSLLCLWSTGQFGISTGGDAGGNQVKLFGGVVSSSNIHSAVATQNQVIFRYNNTTNADEFRWVIPLKHILPPHVTITAVTFTYQSSVAVGTIFGTIYDTTGNSTDSTAIGDTSSHIRPITLSNAYNTQDASFPYLVIGYNVTNAAVVTMTISNVSVTYRY